MACSSTSASVTVALSFLPFSSVLGGVTAASRRDGGYQWGLGIGTAASVVAMIPLAALFVQAPGLATYLGFGISPASPAHELFLGLVGLFFVVYTVGLSALGGMIGVWVRANTTWDLDPMRLVEYSHPDGRSYAYDT